MRFLVVEARSAKFRSRKVFIEKEIMARSQNRSRLQLASTGNSLGLIFKEKRQVMIKKGNFFNVTDDGTSRNPTNGNKKIQKCNFHYLNTRYSEFWSFVAINESH